MIKRITNNVNSLNNKKITSSSSAPSAAIEGDMWFDTTDATLLIYFDSNWVDVATTESYNGVSVVTSSTRPSPAFEGQTIYESDTDRILVWDGSAWVVVANASSTSFPTSLDTNTVDSIAALQAKVGVDSSAVTSSLDYKVSTLETDAVVSDQINEIVKLTQAAYDALTPDANTLYVIVG